MIFPNQLGHVAGWYRFTDGHLIYPVSRLAQVWTVVTTRKTVEAALAATSTVGQHDAVP